MQIFDELLTPFVITRRKVTKPYWTLRVGSKNILIAEADSFKELIDIVKKSVPLKETT